MYGFGPTPTNQLFNGAPPFTYNNLPGDSMTCSTFKSLYNTNAANTFRPDSVFSGSQLYTSYISGSTLGSIETNIKQHCNPFPAKKIDTNTYTGTQHSSVKSIGIS